MNIITVPQVLLVVATAVAQYTPRRTQVGMSTLLVYFLELFLSAPQMQQ